jgi:hypothetical protein
MRNRAGFIGAPPGHLQCGGALLSNSSKDFFMKVNGRELTNDEMDRRLGRQYRKLMAHHLNGGCDHPGTIPVGQMHKVLSDCADSAPARDEVDEPNDPDPAGDGAQAKVHAHDGAANIGHTLSMAEAFEGWGGLPRKPTRRWGCGE